MTTHRAGMRRTPQASLALCGLMLITVAGACTGTAVAPEATPVTPSEETLTVGIVVLDDEAVLSGRLFGPDNAPLVILAHMRPNDQTAWFSFAEELADAGYAALTFDFRGYGLSGGDQDFQKLDDDLAAVIDYYRGQGREQIFLVGASMGGTTSLAVAAQRPVEGIVAISAPSHFEGQDALAAAPVIAAPKLLLASDGDTAAIISLDELVEAAREPITSATYEGNAHGTDLFDPLRSDHADDAKAAILRFLSEHTSR